MQDNDPDDYDDTPGPPAERHFDPDQRLARTANALRSHAELAAAFEGPRKADARVLPGLSPDVARDVQRSIAKLDKSRDGNSPLVPDTAEADRLLTLPDTHDLSTNDYHVARRPGEAIVVRWLDGDETDFFYARVQAHFDAGLAGTRDQLAADAWQHDDATKKYAAALDGLKVDLADRYFRQAVRQHKVAMLSTQTADEINIAFLADHLMSVPVADLVGDANAPAEDEPDEKALAWFFKLFLLRGAPGGVERACFFTFLQKTDDDAW